MASSGYTPPGYFDFNALANELVRHHPIGTLQPGRKPDDAQDFAVWCSCGETCSSMESEEAAIREFARHFAERLRGV